MSESEIFYQIINEVYPSNKCLILYRVISKFMLNNYNLKLNVDVAEGVVLSILEIDLQLGAIIFLFARMPAMIVHSIEKKSRSAFGFKRAEARERFEKFPFEWI